MPPGATMKATRKGKKQETVRSDLAHILGYTGVDMDPLGPPSPVGSEKETAAAGWHFMLYSVTLIDLLQRHCVYLPKCCF